MSLELFKHPFEQHLDAENRRVKLAALVPWDELAAVYSRSLKDDSGRLTVDIRIAIAAIIINKIPEKEKGCPTQSH